MVKRLTKASPQDTFASYDVLLADVARVIEKARRAAAHSVNAVVASTYWLVGGRVVEQKQDGQTRAGYGEELLARLYADLTVRIGCGLSVDNLETMRGSFLECPPTRRSETLSRVSGLADSAGRFQLSWSHYALLVRTHSEHARVFYETEALRGGWMRRQIEGRRRARN
ncbi:MAG: DUF1016 N-terminal domain-containing protein [bacterium]